jgi:hypothetical protein
MFQKTKSFKDTYSLSQRISESNRILIKYPAHVPVIIECDEKLGSLAKHKFLVPSDVSASYLLQSIRKQLKTDYHQSIFMFCNNLIICPTSLMAEIYQNYLNANKTDDDKFLYIKIYTESTFGNTVLE